MIARVLSAIAALVLAASCQSESPQNGSQTNWLKTCDTSADCGDLECACGACTATCSTDADCAARGLGACVAATDTGAIALCDGQAPSTGLCLAGCVEGTCPDGTSCVAGACLPAVEPTAHVQIDPAIRYQTLIGFGASLAYDEGLIVGQPDRAALYDAMFLESGFDALRFRNTFDNGDTGGLGPTGEIIAEATARLGRTPTLFMTSGSPPASLKANGDRFCSASDPTCTLTRATNGSFDYAGFAEHWRASLEAYETAGIHPDFVSIQNNPDYIPPPDLPAVEACHFLPTEGTGPVIAPDGGTVDAAFPGYREALASVQTAVATLPTQYAFASPETGSAVMVGGYASVLDPSTFGALAFHLYGMDPAAVATDQLDGVRAFGDGTGRPVIQSEMSANGLDTAVLAHYSLTAAGAAAYLQQSFVAVTTDEASFTLIGLDGASVVALPAYHALAHFARTTDPGWLRVDAASDVEGVLASAWLSPDGSSLTVVLVNPTDSARNVEVTAPDPQASLLVDATVTRTVFDGVERSAELGHLAESRVVRVPGRSSVTIATAAP